ncbi:MAG TPA: BsuBI/PstI family type II restriction endonuclease [Solirubrobacteraceae bacterium]|nr:BsuBI/PstI family type II restriction endonuclease [Solirubrobacteraceae bacterium]
MSAVSYRPLLPIEGCAERLRLVFPRAAFDAVLSSPGAGGAVAAMLYVGAIVRDDDPMPTKARWVRPTTCLWLSQEAYARADAASRDAYYAAAVGPKAKARVEALHETWGFTHRPLYADNSRETLRDEAFPAWLDHGALRVRPGVKTTSPAPRWALTESFADLFDPALQDEELIKAIEAWRDTHMSPGARLKALTAQQRAQTAHSVPVVLPSGEHRALEPGEASVILKGVIELWAPARLVDPVVLSVSEPGDKVYMADGRMLARLGLQIDQTTLLPDAVIVDIGQNPATFWIVEAVSTDGPVTEDRKRALLEWATAQRIAEGACEFLSAFGSRNSPSARRRLKDLASGTYAWYADEPAHELAWYSL